MSAAVMATRTAVTASLGDLGPGTTVLVACSGGPDSLALAAATAWVAGRRGLLSNGIVVDHGLQDGSAQVADAAATTCAALGIAARVVRVEVAGPGGPEAAARAARYAALEEAAVEAGAAAVLLGHTREDQAETVLLRLSRGSGARSLAAMAPRNGLWRRPFLDLDRAAVRGAAAEVLEPLGRMAWSDPHNEDPAFARVRIRGLLEGLGDALGPAVVMGLSRSAGLLRDDADALEAWSDEVFAAIVTVDDAGWSADCEELSRLPAAVRSRVLRSMALAAGCPPDRLDLEHVRRLRELVELWHGQGRVSLPSGACGERVYGRLWLRSSTPENGAPGGA